MGMFDDIGQGGLDSVGGQGILCWILLCLLMQQEVWHLLSMK